MDDPLPIIRIEVCPGPLEEEPWNPMPPGGAECIFIGRTRPERHHRHGDLERLEYQAHGQMATDSMRKLAHAAVTRWQCLAIRIAHATGPVAVGETSVVIQVICGHRTEAFDACHWLINSLKESVPIWKREHWQHGTNWSAGHPLHPVLDPAGTHQ